MTPHRTFEYYATQKLYNDALRHYWEKYRDELGHQWSRDQFIHFVEETASQITRPWLTVRIFEYFFKEDLWTNVERKQLKMCKGKILDVGCGVGRWLSVLKTKGFNAKGIDLSPASIEIAQERGFNCELIDIMDLPGTEKYNTILMMGGVIAELQDVQQYPALFAKAYNLLETGGFFMGCASYPLPFQEQTENVNGVDIVYTNVRLVYRGQLGGWFVHSHFRPWELAELAQPLEMIRLFDEEIWNDSLERALRDGDLSKEHDVAIRIRDDTFVIPKLEDWNRIYGYVFRKVK